MSKLLAPNGKPSKLTPEQYKLVRKPEFKAWFGDWENYPENSSKVVDSNGEPLVVYHTSPKKFNKFKEQGHWFSNIIFKQYGKNIYTCFLNVKKPFEIHPLSGWYFDKNYDGGFYDNLPNNINWVVYDSNQIKLADGTNTTFDSNNPDIRYAKGGQVYSKEYINKRIEWVLKKRYRNLDEEEYSEIENNLYNFSNQDFPIGLYNLPKKIKLYRVLHLKSEKDFNKDELGVHFIADTRLINDDFLWSIGITKKEYKKLYLVTINVDSEYIDIDWTLSYKARYPNEFEFTLKDNSKYEVESIEKYNPDIRYVKGGLIAPNGKPSNLTPEQYKLVRTDAFKNWFGDWQNDPANASKVVDSNGEPLVVFHGTNEQFNVFNKKGKGNRVLGYFFTTDKDFSENYGESKLYFLNIKKIKNFNSERFDSLNTRQNAENNYWQLEKDKLLEEMYNGVLIDRNDFFADINFVRKDYVAFEPNQIKLADGTNTTFDSNNPDIRFDEGGFVKVKSFETSEGDFDVYDLDENHKHRADMFVVFKDKKGWVVRNVIVPTEFQRKGLATKFYINMNKMSLKNTGKPLHSTQERKLSNGQIVHELSEDGIALWDSLVRDGYAKKVSDKNYVFIHNKFSNGGLIAPNGKPSNLTAEQYKLVRSSAFKKWFGDWENDPANASKVVDEETKEPLVVFHGTYLTNGFFNEFNNVSYFTDNIITANKYPVNDYIFHKTFDEYLDYYGLDESVIKRLKNYGYDVDKLKNGTIMAREDDSSTIWEDYDPSKLFVYECFLNLRNPQIFENADDIDITYLSNDEDERIIDAKIENYDAIIGIYPYKWFSENKINYHRGVIGDYEKENHYITFNANQIKLADGTNNTFDSNNPDIRFEDGGELNKGLFSQIWEWFGIKF